MAVADIRARVIGEGDLVAPARLQGCQPEEDLGVGGLGFLSAAVQGFVLLAAAQGALLSAFLADRILHLGAPLTSFMFEIGGMVDVVQGG